MKLKNNDERKQWLRNYKDWGVWYKDEHIGVTYYRYVFKNGAQLIVAEYVTPRYGIIPEFTSAFYHLVGGPKPQRNSTGQDRWPYHSAYHYHPDNETGLVEFLKYVGKEEADDDAREGTND